MSFPASYRLEIYRGDTFEQPFALWSDTAKTIPHDLTGVTAAAEVRSASGSTPVGTFACTVATNVITVSATTTQTRALPDMASWDLQLTYPSGAVRTVLAGPVVVGGDITASSVVVQEELSHV